MSRFYVPGRNISANRITIDGEEAHHVIDVMRLKEGDPVTVFDGTGVEYEGTISGIDRRDKLVTVGVIRRKVREKTDFPSITLIQAIPKQEKMGFIVEKATELGVSIITPVVTGRTVVRPEAGAMKSKVDKWRRNAVAAAKQCGRADVPEIKDIVTFNEAMMGIKDNDLAMMACLSERTKSIKKVLKVKVPGKLAVLIGPEGDFTPGEMEAASKHGCVFISLGERVLRSDTAGIFVLSALNYEYGL